MRLFVCYMLCANIFKYLSGPLPLHLFELPALKYLDLSFCNISGKIPNSLGKTPNLQYLNLGGNNLTSTIPEGIYKLHALKIVYLQDNNLNGTITPLLFKNLSLIEMISFNNNNLEGTFPAVPKSGLKIFDISQNKFDGILSFFDEVREDKYHPNNSWICNLTVFYVNNNQFGGDIPVNLQQCNNLKTISLHENLFNGLLPDFAYQNNTNITKLSLHNNRLKDNKLSKWLDALFTNNPYLEFLSIYGNDISGHLSQTSAPHLRTFLAHDCIIQG